MGPIRGFEGRKQGECALISLRQSLPLFVLWGGYGGESALLGFGSLFYRGECIGVSV